MTDRDKPADSLCEKEGMAYDVGMLAEAVAAAGQAMTKLHNALNVARFAAANIEDRVKDEAE